MPAGARRRQYVCCGIDWRWGAAKLCGLVFVYECAAYNWLIVYRLLALQQRIALAIAAGVGFNLLWLLSFWCFLQTHFTSPGTLGDNWLYWTKKTAGLEWVQAVRGWQPGRVTMTKRSKHLRPERAHYCKELEADVIRMDHFCPWTGNCIGFRNHKFFLLLSYYGLATAAFGLASSLWVANAFAGSLFSHNETVCFIIFEVFAVISFISLAALLCAHFPLAAENRTSIESAYSNTDNPYDHGSCCENLEDIVGVFGWDWFFPVRPRRPVTDGYSFRKAGEDLPENLYELFDENTLELLVGPQDSSLERLWTFRYNVGGGPAPFQSYISAVSTSDAASFLES
jgi:hypothetical protein